MVAAEDAIPRFEAVADDPHATVLAGRSQDVDRALEGVERVDMAVVGSDGEGAAVDVAAGCTGFHDRRRVGGEGQGLERGSQEAVRRAMDGTATNARALAIDRLVRIARDGAYVARVGQDGGDPDLERLASDLVAGVTRWRRYLDFLAAHFTTGDYNRLDPDVREALRIGLYDLIERGTPPHAAVSEAVEAVRVRGFTSAKGLVNGVLRSAVRAIESNSLPVPSTGKPERDLAVRHSYPTWLVRRWLKQYGDADTEALLRAGNDRPDFGLRVNTRRTSPDALGAQLDTLGVTWRRSAILDDFLVVDRLQPIIREGWLQDGRCAVQDEAAGLVVRVLDPQPGERILDGAAAPGSKALYAAQRMNDEGVIVAVDIHESRVGLIQQAAQAQRATTVEPVVADLTTFEIDQLFDRVLLDAPCTGLGVIAKRADLRWQRTPEDFAELTALQDRLLDAAAGLVRPGGLLVYSTCTLAPEENEDRVATFLGRNPDYSLEPVGGLVPATMQTQDGHYVARPHIDGTDGAFAARLRRSS